MPLQWDPEWAKAFEPIAAMMVGRAKPAVHDVESRRAASVFFKVMLDQMPEAPDVEVTVHHVEAADGHKIAVHEFRKKGAPSPTPTPAAVHYHGGGMILGSVDMFAKLIASQVDATGIPFFSVEYRLAPEVSGTTLVEDSYTALVWLSKNAAQFNVDPARLAVTGESAGGGLAAGVALKARNEGLSPPLAKQILIYPMLDDRNIKPVSPELAALAPIWGIEDNITGWTALLGKDKAGIPDADVSEYTAPARAKSVKGLPSTYIDIGSLDIFRDEDLLYASRIAAENIEIEFHLYPGVPHAWELFNPSVNITQRALQNRTKAFLSL